MDQERGAAVHASLEQAHACVGGIPGLHYHVVQLVAQKFFHDGFVFVVNFQKVGQHTRRSEAVSDGLRLEQPLHRLRGIPVLIDDRFE